MVQAQRYYGVTAIFSLSEVRKMYLLVYDWYDKGRSRIKYRCPLVKGKIKYCPHLPVPTAVVKSVGLGGH